MYKKLLLCSHCKMHLFILFLIYALTLIRLIEHVQAVTGHKSRVKSPNVRINDINAFIKLADLYVAYTSFMYIGQKLRKLSVYFH